MNIGHLDIQKQVMVIAEIGNNHEGNPETAERLICEAAEAGVDAVKFQTLRALKLVGRVPKERLETLLSFELGYPVFERLKAVADREGVVFLSTPFDLESALFLDTLVPAFKIASGDITFLPLIQAVADCHKPVLLSRGAAGPEAIKKAIRIMQKVWIERGTDPGLVLLHCVSMYPAEPETANLSAILSLADAFGLPVGYSDHTLGIDAAVLSVAMGARVVEKHFTLDHEQSGFRDHQLSADPAQMRELVRRVREAERLLGAGDLDPSQDEAEAALGLRRSICAGRDLPAGTRIGTKDISWLRPGGGDCAWRRSNCHWQAT